MVDLRKQRAPEQTGRRDGPASLPIWAAAVLVFASAGAVLVLEIMAVRLVAPYIGISLQVNSAIIGTALTAIAIGAWAGGRIADRVNPRRLIGALLLVSGVFTLLELPLVRWIGQVVNGTSAVPVLILAALSVVVPATLLSTISPLVVKLQLHDLRRTGREVGRLSALGTVGGIIATFVTGFVLVASLPSTTVMVGLGIVLILLGVIADFVLRRKTGVAAAATALAVGAAFLTVAGPGPCDKETTYNCARITAFPEDPSVRVLKVSNSEIGYTDMDEPTRLHMGYVQAIAAATELLNPGGRLDGLHIGGGAMTLAAYLEKTRPAGTQTVYEIDPGLVELAREKLAFRESDRLRVHVKDGRLGLQEQRSAGYDVVIEDAFGAFAPPWHLTTTEIVREARRTLRPGGIYAVNLIDFPPARFARAEVATLRAVFPHVVLVSYDAIVNGSEGGNMVLLASDRPIPVDRLQQNVSRLDQTKLLKVADEERTKRFADDERPLTDDHAPVDQLITVPFRYW
ncbi:fused MFS/spermidine synthase [Nonomuraea typhae]|uniref:Fused MFS/spermidine synthase n=1 Tax=Nonomuraea typhae TaxID=2603600 RepID=A0ABW7Z9J3_9ACTN